MTRGRKDAGATQGNIQAEPAAGYVAPAEAPAQRGPARLPPDFDIFGYVKNNPELRALPGPEHLVRHYLETGQREGLQYQRALDPRFYARLYFPDEPQPAEEVLRRHLETENRAGYANLRELLRDNGFTRLDWVTDFPYRPYIEHNALAQRLANEMQAIQHFVETGLPALLPLSAELRFDPDFYAAFHRKDPDREPRLAYIEWVEEGLGGDLPPNEAAFLGSLDVRLPALPEGFDWEAYGDLCSELSTDWHRWDAFRHFVTEGVPRCAPLWFLRALGQAPLAAIGDRFARAGEDEAAGRIYETALLLGPDEPPLLQSLGDVALRQRRQSRAKHFYDRAEANATRPIFWQRLNASACARELGDWDEAARLLLAALAENPRDRRVTEALLGALRERLAEASGAFSRRLERNAESYTDAQILGDLQVIDAVLRQLHPPADAPRAAVPEGRKLRVAVLANQDLAQCTFYRVRQKAEQLAELADLAIFERSETEAFRAAAATCDIALFYRLAASVDVLDCIAYCRAIGVPTVYEMDDLVFDAGFYPEPYDTYGELISRQDYNGLKYGVPLFRHVMQACDFGLASTEHLAAEMGRLLPGRVAVHRNGLSRALETTARAGSSRPAGATVSIFYGSGTTAHTRDFNDLVEPALAEVLEACPEARFLACGFVDVEGLRERFPLRVHHVPVLQDRAAYLGLLASLVDINLSVLTPGTFNDCKSEIKWLEAAAHGIPSVVSAVGGFRETLRDGTDIVLVSEPGQWAPALTRLVRSPELRARIGRAARERALALYAPDTLGTSLHATLGRFAGRAAAAEAPPARLVSSRGRPLASAAPRRPRILVVHVYFPPQTHGGATRVVRDQVDLLRERYGREFELGVVCGNADPGRPYHLERYSYQGVPVWRIETPLREWMDWTPTDENVRGPFEQVLDAFVPDLIHFHCIQRLGSAVVEAAAARNIPFVVTVHDAWWISDHQFLIDGFGRVRLPWEAEELGTEANPHSYVDSMQRRSRLFSGIARAASVLAVSRSFARIYERAGVPNVVAVPNGVPALPPSGERVKGPEGKLRLGHVGGLASHKGAPLLRATLGRGRFDRFEVIAVDLAMREGESRRETWGATEVTIIGPVRQEEIASLYARMDVLVAPSLWPESFGLVTREAAAFGLWVVASNMGAIGEDVREGVDGFVFDAADPEALGRTLRLLHDDIARFREPPPARAAFRTVADQVEEVVGVYRRVLGGGTARKRRSA